MTKEYRWDVENRTRVGEYLSAVENEFLQSFLAGKKIKTAIDLGCGSGRFTIPIHQRGIKIAGVDNDLLPLSLLKKKCPEIKTRCLDISKKLPFNNDSFDCILAIQSVDYVPSLDKLLAECKRILKKKGYLVFTLANKTSYKKILYQVAGKDKGNYQYSFRETRRAFKKNGFNFVRAYGYNWIPFYRDSNNRLVDIFAHLEKKLNLWQLPLFSPWIFYITQLKK